MTLAQTVDSPNLGVAAVIVAFLGTFLIAVPVGFIIWGR